jgi:hypothetical protein
MIDWETFYIAEASASAAFEQFTAITEDLEGRNV